MNLDLTRHANELETYVRDATRHVDAIHTQLRELAFLARLLNHADGDVTSDELDRLERVVSDAANAMAPLMDVAPKLEDVHADLEGAMGV